MISVVVPAYNEEKQIEKCLDSLVNQSTTQKFEVIIIDNNSNDKTAEIAKKYEKILNLKIFMQKIKGRGAARQKGFYQANGEIILWEYLFKTPNSLMPYLCITLLNLWLQK